MAVGESALSRRAQRVTLQIKDRLAQEAAETTKAFGCRSVSMHRTRSHTSGAAGSYAGRVDVLGGMRSNAHSDRSAPPIAHASPSAKSQECHICLEDLRQELAACPCGHVYHEMCILQALEVNAQCPICRRKANANNLVRLYFDVPAEPSNPTGAGATTITVSASGDRFDGHTAALNDRVAVLIDRLQWQKKQHDMLLTEIKRLRHQSEQLLADKQSLLQRVATLEMNKNELLNKVAKYQVELSRQAEASRQMAVNQSIINYLNTCDGEALEEEVQNPRELIAALKKACKFRHDQYQKVVKEKMRLKAMLQSAGSQQSSAAPPRKSPEPDERVLGKARLKSPMDNKRAFHMHDYAQPPQEMKKRRVTISPPPTVMTAHNNAPPVASSPYASHSEAPSGFRANAYTDVAVRPMAPRAAPFGRSSYNPSQYGAYNITPSNAPPVQVSDHAVCRRGYDETGKLTTFFLPKDSKRSGAALPSSQRKPVPGMQDLLGLAQRSTANAAGLSGAHASGPQMDGRREYALTSWLSKGQS